jgi:hypothetical protein
LISGDQLNHLWINVSELLVILNDLFSSSINAVNPLIYKLTPILECFFIIYKITTSKEEDKAKPKIVKIS